MTNASNTQWDPRAARTAGALYPVLSQSFYQAKYALLLDTLIQRVPRTARNRIAPIDQPDLSG